jgi:hypothetical protein
MRASATGRRRGLLLKSIQALRPFRELASANEKRPGR